MCIEKYPQCLCIWVFFIISLREINPADVVANRANVATQYNEAFLNDNELTELW